MQNDSYLAPDDLFLQSQNALEVIELENEKYETLKSDFQSNVVNYTGTGEVATSLKNYAEDFCMILDKAIEANDLDKADHETVENAVETIYADKVDIHENLDGAVILTNIETAQGKIQEIEDRISEIESMSLWDSMWHSVFGSDSVSDLQSQKEGWEKTLEDFQNKEYRYDGIESSTAGLFNDSEGVRELVWAGLEAMENSFIDGEYCPEANVDYASSIYQLRYADFYSACRGNVDSNGQALYSNEDIYWYIKYLESQEGFNKDNIQENVDGISRGLIEYSKLCNCGDAALYYASDMKYVSINGTNVFYEIQHGGVGKWSKACPLTDNVCYKGCFYYADAAVVSSITGEPYTLEQLFVDSGAKVTYENGYFNLDNTGGEIRDLYGNPENLERVLKNAGISNPVVNPNCSNYTVNQVKDGLRDGNVYLLYYDHGASAHWVALVGLDANDSIIVACSNKNTEGKRLSVISDSFSELEDNYKKVNCIYEISWD